MQQNLPSKNYCDIPSSLIDQNSKKWRMFFGFLVFVISVLLIISYKMIANSLYQNNIYSIVFNAAYVIIFIILARITYSIFFKKKSLHVDRNFFLMGIVNIIFIVSLLFLPMDLFMLVMMTDSGQVPWYYYLLLVYVMGLSPFSILVFFFLQKFKEALFVKYKLFIIYFNIPMFIVIVFYLFIFLSSFVGGVIRSKPWDSGYSLYKEDESMVTHIISVSSTLEDTIKTNRNTFLPESTSQLYTLLEKRLILKNMKIKPDYVKKSDTEYSLCANFSFDADDKRYVNNEIHITLTPKDKYYLVSSHKKGYQCFDFDASFIKQINEMDAEIKKIQDDQEQRKLQKQKDIEVHKERGCDFTKLDGNCPEGCDVGWDADCCNANPGMEWNGSGCGSRKR